MSKRETSSEIDAAAADWALRMDEAALDGKQQAKFERWLSADVRRVGAYARAQAVLVHVKRAKALGTEFEPSSYNSHPLPRDAAEAIRPERPDRPVLTRRRMLIGASAVAASGAIAFFVPSDSAVARVYETGRGETRLIPLEDGTTVTLNTQSRISVSLDRAARLVTLERGEALFKVASNKHIPFLVQAGDMSLRAEKATFSVCQLDERPLEVKVCDGSVEMERSSFATRRTHVLGANVRATLSQNGTIIQRDVPPEAMERELAWQEGMLSFVDTPLSQAAEEFARYSNRRIRIADVAVGAETVTGRFSATNPEGFARAVALGLNLNVRSTPDGITLGR